MVKWKNIYKYFTKFSLSQLTSLMNFSRSLEVRETLLNYTNVTKLVVQNSLILSFKVDNKDSCLISNRLQITCKRMNEPTDQDSRIFYIFK